MEYAFLSGLNDAQRRLATDVTHNLYVSAPAGTGKTRALAARMAYLIGSGTAKADTLLCLTFTNKACKEMRERIIDMCGKDGQCVTVLTIHSFCYHLLRAESKNLDLPADFLIFDDEDTKTAILQLPILTTIQNRNDRKLPQALANFTEDLKRCRCHYGESDRLLSYDEALNDLMARPTPLAEDSSLDQWLRTNGAVLVRQYDAILSENHALDFTDLIVHTATALADEATCQRWRSRYAYIAIDEMQDTSRTEYALLRRLFPGRQVLLCGDTYQTIYSWRGSSPRLIEHRFEADCAPFHIDLVENYRSTKTLLTASQQVLTAFFGDSARRLSRPSCPDEGEPIALHKAVTVDEEGRWIYRKIEALGPDAVGTTCVLARNRFDIEDLSEAIESYSQLLGKNGITPIPFTKVDQYRLFKRQEIKDVLAFLKVALNRHDTTSAERILKGYAQRIGPRTIASIKSDAYKHLGISLSDFLDENVVDAGDPYALLLEKLHDGKVVVFDVESTGTDTTTDEIIQIAAIKIDDHFEVIDRFNRLIRPSKSVGESAAVHGMTDEFLAVHGDDARTVLTAFLDFAANSLIVGHNVTYDLAITSSNLQRLGLMALQDVPYYDTLGMYRRFYPDLENHRLENLSKRFNPDDERSSHDAFDDVVATKGILRHAVETFIAPQTVARQSAMAIYTGLFKPVSKKVTALRAMTYSDEVKDIITFIVKQCGVRERYGSEERDGVKDSRMEKIRQLYRIAQDQQDPSLSYRDNLTAFLSIAALSNSEFDTMLKKRPSIPIITVHQVKGLEFDNVFIASLEDKTFPSYQAYKNKDLSEEMRLFYVAMTRAKKRLYLSWHERGPYGRKCQPSPFLQAVERVIVDAGD